MPPKLGKLKFNPVKISPETANFMKLEKLKKLEFLAHVPKDPPHCMCEAKVRDWRTKASNPNFRPFMVECPKRFKVAGYKQFRVVCGKCEETNGFLFAKDKRTGFNDWCDCHYYNYAEKGRWFGATTVQISPIDLSLRWECFCGNTNRDFRMKGGPLKRGSFRLEEV